MLIKVSQPLLNNALQQIAYAVPAKSLTPILSFIKLESELDGITLTACNGSMMLQCKIPLAENHVLVHQIGSALIPARYLIDIIRNLTADLITLTIDQNMRISIQSGHAIYRLNSMDPEHFPRMADFDNQDRIQLPNLLLKKWIKQVSFAASSSETRPLLTGVSCQFGHNEFKMLATDGVRLASRKTALNHSFTERNAPIIVPGKNLINYAKILNDEDAVTVVTIAGNRILFKSNNLMMQSSLIEGTYPSIDKITPNSYTTEITVNSSCFLHALERVSLMAEKDNIVKLHLTSEKTVQLFTKTAEVGDVLEEVSLEEINGLQLTIFFNGKYMIDIMRAIDSLQVLLRFSGKWNPIIVQPADNLTALYVLTPIRSN
ncbi:MAG: DNA polymerase III subunit beta [Bacillota bacterium]